MMFKSKEAFIIWLKAAGARAIRTCAQTAIATIGTSRTVGGISWPLVASTAAVAAILSILTSLTGLPEVRLLENESNTNDDTLNG